MILFLRIVRGFVGIFMVFQVIGISPVLTYVGNFDQFNGPLIGQFVLKTIVLLFLMFCYSKLRKVINRIHAQRSGSQGPLLASVTSL